MKQEHVDSLLVEIRNSNVIAFMRSQGASSKQIKDWIISVLSPLFRDHTCLNELAVEALAPEAVRILRLKQDHWAFAVLKEVLDIYWASDSKCHDDCVRICADWHAAIIQGLSSYWSLYRLHEQRDSLSAEDRVFQQFRNIGALLESVIQPRLRELLGQVRHARGKDHTVQRIAALKFGNVVSELKDTSTIADACTPAPWGIAINQWRNVSQHHSFILKQGFIEVEYGESHNRIAATLTQSELGLLEVKIAELFNALEAARTIFAFDNWKDFADTAPPVNLRHEARLVQLATAISTQGFNLCGLEIRGDCVEAEIADVSGGDPISRMVHVSQFLFVVWRHFPSDRLRLRFLPFDHERPRVFSCSGSLCESIANGSEPFETLGREFEMHVE